MISFKNKQRYCRHFVEQIQACKASLVGHSNTLCSHAWSVCLAQNPTIKPEHYGFCIFFYDWHILCLLIMTVVAHASK